MIKNCWNKLQKKQSLSKDFIEETDENSSAKNSLLFNLVINRSLNVRTEPLPADTIYSDIEKREKRVLERYGESGDMERNWVKTVSAI